jgi:3-methyladenine DNA glycosylase/8-oxoguanine DNA glycosylase
MDARPDRSLHWQPAFPVDAKLTLKSLRRGRPDPTHREEPDGSLWRTALTSTGPVTYRIRQHRLDDLDVDAWGPGAGELVENIPAELGAHDHPEDFRPAHPVLERAWRRLPGLRVPRTGRVFEAFVPAVLEQRVVSLDAQAAWARLLRAHGTPAPGPAPAAMRVVPPPGVWARIPIWDWRRAGVDLRRSNTVALAARHAGKLERAAADPARAYRLLSAMPGLGVWTAAQVGHRALGDADALPLGDFDLGRLTGLALAGRPLADEEVEAFYRPWRPHRYRVVRALELTPRIAPRRGHRAPRARPFR